MSFKPRSRIKGLRPPPSLARRLKGWGGVPGGLCPRGGAPKGTIPNRTALLAVRDEGPMALPVSEVTSRTPKATGFSKAREFHRGIWDGWPPFSDQVERDEWTVLGLGSPGGPGVLPGENFVPLLPAARFLLPPGPHFLFRRTLSYSVHLDRTDGEEGRPHGRETREQVG